MTQTLPFFETKKVSQETFLNQNGVREATRTPDRSLRRRLLYPAELRRHITTDKLNYTIKVLRFQVLFLI